MQEQTGTLPRVLASFTILSPDAEHRETVSLEAEQQKAGCISFTSPPHLIEIFLDTLLCVFGPFVEFGMDWVPVASWGSVTMSKNALFCL